jgi:hypothetical protein
MSIEGKKPDSVLTQPGSPKPIIGHILAHLVPEPRGVVRGFHVSKLMEDDIISHRRGSHDKEGVQGHHPPGRSASPSGAHGPKTPAGGLVPCHLFVKGGPLFKTVRGFPVQIRFPSGEKEIVVLRKPGPDDPGCVVSEKIPFPSGRCKKKSVRLPPVKEDSPVFRGQRLGCDHPDPCLPFFQKPLKIFCRNPPGIETVDHLFPPVPGEADRLSFPGQELHGDIVNKDEVAFHDMTIKRVTDKSRDSLVLIHHRFFL